MIGIYHNDLNRQREQLIQLLIEYNRIKGHDITIVFDGWKSGSGREEQSTTGGIRVIYSRLGEKADAVIKRIISRERQEWIVISSDREITSHAWSCGSVPVPSAEFQSLIEKSDLSKAGKYDLIEEDYDDRPSEERESAEAFEKRKGLDEDTQKTVRGKTISHLRPADTLNLAFLSFLILVTVFFHRKIADPFLLIALYAGLIFLQILLIRNNDRGAFLKTDA